MNLDRQTALLKAMGRIEGFKNDLHRLNSELSGAPLWLPGRRLEKQCSQAIGMIDGIAERFDRKLVVTLVGPSGSGKTTTLMMVAGFLIPTYGDIVVDNQSIVTVPPHKRNIGMMFQHDALFPHMSVADNIAFPLQMRRMPKDKISERVSWALDLVQL